MTPYYIMLAVPALIGLIFRSRHKDEFNSSARKSAPIVAFFLIFGILLACRDITCGVDLANYQSYFYKSGQCSWKTLLISYKDEFLYHFLNKLVYTFSADFRVFLAVTAAVTVLPLMYFYKKNADIPYLTILLFLTVVPFSIFFSGLRQAIAMIFVIPAWHFAKKKKLILFAVVVIIAMKFHNSAFVIFAVYPLYHLKITAKCLLGIVPLMGAVFAFNKPIFSFLARLFGREYYEKYGVQTSGTGAYAMLVLFVMFAIFAYVFPDNQKLDSDTLAMRNYLLLSVFIQMFAPVHNLAMRVNYYYLLFIPVLIPRILVIRKKRYYQLGVVAAVIMGMFFLSYYIFNMHNGADVLRIYPYVAFWEGLN